MGLRAVLADPIREAREVALSRLWWASTVLKQHITTLLVVRVVSLLVVAVHIIQEVFVTGAMGRFLLRFLEATVVAEA